MNFKPAAIVFHDAAGLPSGEVVDLGAALERYKRIVHGTEQAPPGIVYLSVISGRGIEKRTKLTPADAPITPQTKSRKG